MKNRNILQPDCDLKNEVDYQDYPTFRERLEKYRTDKTNYTQEEFSEFLGVSYRAYTYWINGKEYDAKANKTKYVVPKMKTLCKICDTLGVSLDYLFGRAENISEENAVIEKAFGIKDNAIENLKAVVKEFHSEDNQSKIYKEHNITLTPQHKADTLNVLLSSPELAYAFFDSVHSFLGLSEYKYPVSYHYPFGISQTLRCDFNDNPTVFEKLLSCERNNIKQMDFTLDGTPRVWLSRDENNPRDNVPIPIDDSFIESSAILNIQRTLLQLKHKNDNEDNAKKKRKKK